MLSENLRLLRKKRGLSQEDLAVRLNVVRQTVSKWEKGTSVPDAEMLTKIADILEATVSELLGAHIENEGNQDRLANELSHINEQLAIKNRRTRRILKIIAIIICTIVAISIMIMFLNYAPIQ